MTDLVDAMMGALGLVERFVELRQQQRARAALEEWAIEIEEEIDGLAEIERIRAAAGLPPYRGWASARRPTRGRWSPSSPMRETTATEVRDRPAPTTRPSPTREPPPEPAPIDLGPREHVEGDGAVEIVDAEILDPETLTSEILDTEVIDAEIVEVVAKTESPSAVASLDPQRAEQLDLFADLLATPPAAEPATTTTIVTVEATIETPVADIGPVAAEPRATHIIIDDPEPIEVHALAVVERAPTPRPPAEEQALRDALMTAEAARARPAEARRLYEEVLIVVTQPSAPFHQTLYAALALLGTSECDFELGDLDAAMANSGDAWSWARRAHAQHPSDETLQVLSLTAQTYAHTAEQSGDRQQLAEVLAECLSVIEPELARRDLPAAREVRLGLRSRLMTLRRPMTSPVRKGAVTPSLTLTTLQGVRP